MQRFMTFHHSIHNIYHAVRETTHLQANPRRGYDGTADFIQHAAPYFFPVVPKFLVVLISAP